MALTFEYEYAVLRVTPDPIRGESVNIGLAVFLKDEIDVRILPTLGKVSALDGRVDLGAILALPDVVRDWYVRVKPIPPDAPLQHFGIVSISEKAQFRIGKREQYEAQVEKLMKRLVVPLVAARRPLPAHTRIAFTLKSAFKKQGLLGSRVEDISKHMVVQGFPISVEENLYAEFALKNSQYHITETTDFRSETLRTKDRSRVASLAAIKFVEAQRAFKADGCRRYAVYAAKRDSDVKSEIAMLANNSDGVINVKSRAEMAAYMELIMSAASHTHSLA